MKGAFAVFICHQQDGRICAGWAACHDMEENLALRLAVSDEHLSRDDAEATVDYETPVPVFESGAAAAAHGLASIETPPPEAIRAQRRLARRLGDKIQYG